MSDIVKSMLESPQFAHLRKEVCKFVGRDEPYIAQREIIVIEQCGLTDAKRGRIEYEMKKVNGGIDYLIADDFLGLQRLYLDLASTSFGDVPNFIEFATMPSADMNEWTNAGLLVNPNMLNWVDELAKAIEEVDKELAKAEEDKKK